MEITDYLLENNKKYVIFISGTLKESQLLTTR